MNIDSLHNGSRIVVDLHQQDYSLRILDADGNQVHAIDGITNNEWLARRIYGILRGAEIDSEINAMPLTSPAIHASASLDSITGLCGEGYIGFHFRSEDGPINFCMTVDQVFDTLKKINNCMQRCYPQQYSQYAKSSGILTDDDNPSGSGQEPSDKSSSAISGVDMDLRTGLPRISDPSMSRVRSVPISECIIGDEIFYAESGCHVLHHA